MAYLSELFRWFYFLYENKSSSSICKQNRSARYVIPTTGLNSIENQLTSNENKIKTNCSPTSSNAY